MMLKGGMDLFRMTCFLNIPPEKLTSLLVPLKFQKTRDSLVWRMDDHYFSIHPFKNQPRNGVYGYRVLFNGQMQGGIYLFDQSLSTFTPKIVSVEYILDNDKDVGWWRNQCLKYRLKKRSTGAFRSGRVSIVLTGETIHFMIRSSAGKGLKVYECFKEIDELKDLLVPSKVDLFSFAQ